MNPPPWINPVRFALTAVAVTSAAAAVFLTILALLKLAVGGL